MTLYLLVIYYQHFIEDSLLTVLKNEVVSLFVMSVTCNVTCKHCTISQKTKNSSHISTKFCLSGSLSGLMATGNICTLRATRSHTKIIRHSRPLLSDVWGLTWALLSVSLSLRAHSGEF